MNQTELEIKNLYGFKCPNCNSKNITWDKYCFFMCQDCNKTFDIPLED